MPTFAALQPPSTWSAQQRATCLLDAPGPPLPDTNHIHAPWLAALGLEGPADDGLRLARGYRAGRPTLVIATDPLALAGTLGDVGGTRAGAAIERLRREQACRPRAPGGQVLLWLDGGGVRLQEGNAALLAAHTLLTALARARQELTLVAIITGRRGCYGALALAAGLCHHRIMVAPSRLGLSGPKVMERMLRPGELDSTDSARVDAMHGALARLRAHLVHQVVPDEAAALHQAVHAGLQDLPQAPADDPPRCQDEAPWAAPTAPPTNRGMAWLQALAAPQSLEVGAGGTVGAGVCRLGNEQALLLATGPGAHNPAGALGSAQARLLAARLRALRLPQRPSTGQVTAVVLVVDGPGQAMSFEEEFQGLHQTLAQLRAEGERTILAGYATVGLIVGAAVSGGLLCHGLGAQRLIALDHPAVDIRPMAPAGSQRLLERSAGQAALAGPQLTALQTSGRAFLRLGGVQALVPVAPADALGAADVARVRAALTEQLLAARHNLQHHGERFEPASFGSRVWAKEVWGVMANT